MSLELPKIAIVVHGRFHAFDLAGALIELGYDVTLFTNYPKSVAKNFGVPSEYTKSFLAHGILSRVLLMLRPLWNVVDLNSVISILFAKWASREVCKNRYDVVYCFSSISEELFDALNLSKIDTIKILVRGSSHIKTQSEILIEEDQRFCSLFQKQKKSRLDHPSQWTIEREVREYIKSDLIFVLSSFAYRSFVDHQVLQEKLRISPLGAQLSLFRPEKNVIEHRCQRILSNQPLNILMVGTFSLRKGAIDFVQIVRSTEKYDFRFRFVGAVTEDATNFLRSRCRDVEFVPRQAQSKLPNLYAEADIFIFTTIEDGYAVVISQAQAAGLPILATENCSAVDVVSNGETGWVFPIRSPDAFVERLIWCNEHRQELAAMVKQVYEQFQPRDWAEVATDFVTIVQDYKQNCSLGH
jgi:glycosyltransferase involved in cell wall biosynthesis